MAHANRQQLTTRTVLAAVGAGAAVAVIMSLVSFTDWYRRIEGTSLDARFRSRPTIASVPRLVTIDIDTESLEREKAWPWPRDRHVRLVNIMDELQVHSLAFDIFFADSAPPPSITRDRFFELNQIGEPLSARHFEDADQELTLSIARAGNVYLAQTFGSGQLDTQIRLKRDERRLRELVKKGLALRCTPEEAAIFPLMQSPDAVPLPRFAAAARGVGCVQTDGDPDGVTRHFPILVRYDLAIEEGEDPRPCLFPSMPFLMALHDLDAELSEVVLGPGRMVTIPVEGAGRTEAIHIPLNEDGKALINWVADWRDAFQHVSYAALENIEGGLRLARVKRALAGADQWQETLVDVLTAEYPSTDSARTMLQVLLGAHTYEALLEERPSITADEAVPMLLGEAAKIPAAFAQQETVFLNVAAHRAAIMGEERPEGVSDELWHSAGIVATELARNGGATADDHPFYFLPPVDVEGAIVFAGRDSPVFRDAVCFYGLTATGTHDLRPTPFNPQYPLLGVHPTMYSSIVSNQLLQEMPRAWRLPLFAVLAMLVALYSVGSGPARVALLTIGLLGAYIGAIFFIFVQYGWVGELSGATSTIVLTAVAVSYQSYRREEAQRKFIRGAFEQYMNPNIVAAIAEDPEGLKLGGVELDATAFFSDVAGFTTISESLSSQDLVALLNEYLTAMTEIVFQYDGLLDKYEGDAIIAIFGAPLQTEDHAIRACYASLDMQRKLVEMRANWAAQGRPELVARIGLNSGPMTVGNMGSTMRFDYTMMGDTVNLASRLEGANKQYGTYLMCSEFTLERCRGAVQTRELDLLRVKGKNVPVRVFEVYAKENETVETNLAEAVRQYNEGLGLYKRRDFESAKERFAAGLAAVPADGPCQTYLARCETYIIEPPPADWDGVYTMTTK